ncbi:MAG: hypothetical protein ACR2QM_13470 [Longimicrobiales bacterium]
MVAYDLRLQVGLLVTRFSGVVDDGQLVGVYTELVGHPEWRAGLDEFADLRGADLTAVSSEGLRRVAELSERLHSGADKVPRTAVLVDQDVNFGLGRMYEAFSAESPETLQLFRDLDAALEWLGVPPDVLD